MITITFSRIQPTSEQSTPFQPLFTMITVTFHAIRPTSIVITVTSKIIQPNFKSPHLLQPFSSPSMFLFSTSTALTSDENPNSSQAFSVDHGLFGLSETP